MPRETLFVRIDDTPVPDGVEYYCDIIDCRETNEGCSFLGDAVLGDVKDAEGTPYYRILTPAGKLISDFEAINKSAFQQITGQWYEVLARLLQDTDYSRPYTVSFPLEYIDWLRTNVNEYYNTIGKDLLINDCTIEVSGKDIYDEIIINKISKKISEALKATNYEFVVFSSSSVVAQSPVINDLLLGYQHTHFITFSQLEKWGMLCEERRLCLKESLTYEKFYSQNETEIKNLINTTFNKLTEDLKSIQLFSFFNGLSPSMKMEADLREAFDYQYRGVFETCEKYRTEVLSEMVHTYRENNEITVYNSFEKKICETLGEVFKVRPYSSFVSYWFPNRVYEDMKLFVQIIIENNRNNALEDIGKSVLSKVSTFPHRTGNDNLFFSNDFYERLMRALYFNYERNCMKYIKESMQNIWKEYENKPTNPTKQPKSKQPKTNQSSEGCYITTAMCHYLGKDDDCVELTTLRGFRDNWLKYQPNGAELVQEYYKYAPLIVERINEAPNKDNLYGQISNHIYACISAIQNQQYEKAKDMYISMTRHLAEVFL